MYNTLLKYTEGLQRQKLILFNGTWFKVTMKNGMICHKSKMTDWAEKYGETY